MAQLQYLVNQHGGLVQQALVQDDFSRLNGATQQQLGGFVSIGNGAGGVQHLVQGTTLQTHLAAQRPQFAPAQAQPRQQLQYVQAYTADGQPITIAINASNGSHTMLAQQQQQQQQFVTASLAPQQQAQALQARHAGMNLISVGGQTNGGPQVFKLVQQQPNGTTTLVPNGATIVQNGAQRHILVPSNAATANRGMPVAVQRFVPSNGLQAVTMRQAGQPGQQVITTQQAGIPMGRSLITMASRPNTVTTYNPTTGMRTNPNVPIMSATTTLQQQATPAVQQLQLPSTMLVRPSNAQAGQLQTAGTLLQQQSMASMPQLLQQQPQPQNLQVKDTAAQQRQQQLLASLRQRVASLHQVQGNGTTVQGNGGGFSNSQAGASGNATPTVHGIVNGQSVQLSSDSGNTANTAMLQALLNAQQFKQQEQMRLNNALLNANQQLAAAQQQQHQSLDGGLMSLTSAQQQAMMNDAAASDQVLLAQQQMLLRDALGHGGPTLQEFMQSNAMADELQRQQAKLLDAQQSLDKQAGGQQMNGHLTSLDGNNSVQSLPVGKHMNSVTNSLGQSLSADMLEQANGGNSSNEANEKRPSQGQDSSNGGGLMQLRAPQMSPSPAETDSVALALGANPLASAMSTSGEDLRAILSSIGVELARHGIALSTAVEAGWLGVLTSADVSVLEEAYMQEESRLTMSAQKEQMWRHALPANNEGLTSNGSPAASVMSAGAIFEHHSNTAGLAPTEGNGDIDDAHFSAFAYDFFGGSMGLGGGTDGELLEPLELGGIMPGLQEGGDINSKPSSLSVSSAGQFNAATCRVPSWPSGADASSLGMQAAGESMAAFSDLGQPRTSASAASDKDHSPDNASTTSSNHELVARIANLDLGCGFY